MLAASARYARNYACMPARSPILGRNAAHLLQDCRHSRKLSSSVRKLQIAQKAEIEVAPRGRLAAIVPPKRCTEISHRIGSKFGGSHSLKWITPPRNILLVKKQDNLKTLEAAERILKHIQAEYPETNLIVEKELATQLGMNLRSHIHVLDEQPSQDVLKSVDLAISLGGDGTVLHVASMFAQGAVPPVLGVNMGTLGFLMPFGLGDFEGALAEVMASRASMLLRLRLRCVIHDADGCILSSFDQTANQALNEVTLHRGLYPHLTRIETYVDGQYLTEAIADGLIISTPTGSTAYSLSAGGPIVHPSVPSLLLTPICPRSLSFRSVLLPSDACIQLRLSSDSRSSAELSLDGHILRELQPSQYLSISMSPYPVPCIVPSLKPTSKDLPAGILAYNSQAVETIKSPGTSAKPVAETDKQTDEALDGGWVQDINGMLNFNKAFVTKGMMKHVADD